MELFLVFLAAAVVIALYGLLTWLPQWAFLMLGKKLEVELYQEGYSKKKLSRYLGVTLLIAAGLLLLCGAVIFLWSSMPFYAPFVVSGAWALFAIYRLKKHPEQVME